MSASITTALPNVNRAQNAYSEDKNLTKEDVDDHASRLSPAQPCEEQAQPEEDAYHIKSEPSSPEDGLITAEMLNEEKKLNEETQAEEKRLYEEELVNAKQKRFKQLQHLLEKSKFYSKFLLDKMERQQAAKDKQLVKEQKSVKIQEEPETLSEPANTRSTRSKTKQDTNSTKDSPIKVEPLGRRGRKRKTADNFKVADFVDKEVLVKKIKLEEEKDQEKQEDDESETVQPTLLSGGVMRDYQIAGFKWLKLLFENGVNGILADEMGLGKTIQCIALIAHLIEKKVPGPFLVCAPLSTLPNWINEFAMFTPNIPTILYHGSIEDREKKQKHFRTLQKVTDDVSAYPVIITSYEVAMKDSREMQRFVWKYIVVDEGHRIKNMNCRLVRELKTYKSVNRLLLTGTPLQNNLAELWSLLNFLLPEIFDNLIAFEAWFDVNSLKEDGAEERIVAQEQQEHILSILHEILTPFLLRRMKCDVDLILPPKKEIIVYAPLTKLQQEYYKSTVERTIWKTLGFDRNDEKVELSEDIMKETKRMTRKSHGHLFEKNDTPRPSESCKTFTGIVNVKMQNTMMQLRKIVNHPYLLMYPMDFQSGTVKADEDLVDNAGKMKVLDAMLPELKKRGHKVLLFSQMTMMTDVIADYCDFRKYNFVMLDGRMNMNERQVSMESFKNDPEVFIFLISTRAGGLGLNLIAADTVIIYDSDWNPQCDLQAQDRCHRIGQTKPVHVYRLVTANTIDERVVVRAASKRKLEKMIIHKDKFKNNLAETNVLNTDDLLKLLKSTDYDAVVSTRTTGKVFTDEELDALLDRSDMMGNSKPKVNELKGVFQVVKVEDEKGNII